MTATTKAKAEPHSECILEMGQAGKFEEQQGACIPGEE